MIDLTGKRFGRLTVLYEGERVRQECGKCVRTWVCKCDCGNIVIVRQYNLTRKPPYNTTSCGCYARQKRSENMRKLFTTHGYSNERLYYVWTGIRRRCEKEYDQEYEQYGGRGIKLCDEWHEYPVFRQWALDNGYDFNAKRGECTIDRIDNDGDYTPDNCRISNMKTQANNTSRNKKYFWNNGMFTLSEIIELSHTKLSRRCLYKRLKRGLPVEEALSLPLMKNQYGYKEVVVI